MIRSAQNNDQQAIEDLVFSVLTDYGLQADPATTDADLQDIEGNYIKNGGAFDVYLNSANKIIGTVGLYPIRPGLCELRKMYLNPEERGKGIGIELLEHALSKAKELGFRRVMLETASELKEAIALYRKYGFEPFEPDHLSNRCDQAFIKEI